MKTRAALFFLTFVISASALADTCYVSYAQYEAGVPHFDIHTCPAAKLEKDKGFCRLGLQGSDVLIYHFKMENDRSCLVAIDRYDFNEFTKKYGSSYTF